MSSPFPEFVPVSPYKVNAIGEMNPVLLGEIRAFLEQDPPKIPIKQISGFTGWQVLSAYVSADEATSSSSYGALATPGPRLDNLAPGQYALVYGFLAHTNTSGTASQSGHMAPSVNGAAPAASSEAIAFTAALISGASATGVLGTSVTLTSDGGNTIEMLYLTADGGSVSFRNRWLLAFRFA
jgi:hypothetical protein